ncbi:[protein-PII] uridylyltransferase [Nisaea denitrificans]|uniref:[protein-PII] uridylyltransferase n=1 Tax=Nisaea denitrificans TaxID=390877 RepID=UPI00041FF6DC|nr:[protein-PII] uridylyltransferase [Nisaea denitrificans]
MASDQSLPVSEPVTDAAIVTPPPKIKSRKKIIDPVELEKAVDALWEAADKPEGFRTELLALLRRTVDEGRSEIERRFLDSNDGAEAIRANAYLMDVLVHSVAETATQKIYKNANPTQGEQICIAAVGGYGRGEMAPFSDLDLLFLLPYKQTPYSEQVVEYILYLLWDLRLKVGHSTRSVDECVRQAKADMTIRTSLLELRYLWGSEPLFADLRERFRKDVETGTAMEFVEAKLAEAEERHERLGDSRYVIEPNIKEGKGGLRDLHRLFWIGKYVYKVDKVKDLVDRGVLTAAEARKFAKAQKMLWTIRCHLHYLTGRGEERLTVDLQTEIAKRMGYTNRAGAVAVERFMKHYYLTSKDVGDLTRIFCANIEAENQKRPRLRLSWAFSRKPDVGDFRVDGDRLNVTDDEMFSRDPVNLIRFFHTAQKHDLELHPYALRLVTQNLKKIDKELRKNEEANRLFVEMLEAPQGPERIFRRMNEAQVLGRFVPDFGRVVAQMQYDMYHVYTVDEHTIVMLGILHKVEKGELADAAPIASEVVHKVLSRRALYVAVFLHDIAKGRGGDHSKLGERVARRLCPRLGLTDEETETVAWLVRWHLLMTYAAFKRDVNDPKTVQDFSAIVQSPERLRLLLVLTVADIRAVGPNVWNGWKAALLRELYWAADGTLSGLGEEAGRKRRTEEAKNALAEMLPDWSQKEIEWYQALGYPDYWLAFDAEAHVRHARMVHAAEAEQRDLAVESRVDTAREVTEITVYTSDHPGLFSRVTGAMAVSGASIVDARIATFSNGMALDVFWIQDEDRKAFDRPDKLAKLSVAIEQALTGRLNLLSELVKRRRNIERRARVMKIPTRVLIDNKASVTHTVIEVNATDRPGVLYRIARALREIKLQISSAKISTYGESFVDVFYVKDLFGLKIDSETRIQEIRSALLTALAEDAASPPGESNSS